MKITRYLSASLLAIVCTLALGCAGSPTQESTGEYFSDSWITTKVKAALIDDSLVKSSEVNVETFKGTVQLSGFVVSQAAMDQAVLLAGDVDGVTSVKNGMRLK
jgi:hyperosmotically inducible protein